MIFTDLDCLEVVSEHLDVVGGSGDFDYNTYVSQYLNSYQSSYAVSDAESQFGPATAVATAFNTANITQIM